MDLTNDYPTTCWLPHNLWFRRNHLIVNCWSNRTQTIRRDYPLSYYTVESDSIYMIVTLLRLYAFSASLDGVSPNFYFSSAPYRTQHFWCHAKLCQFSLSSATRFTRRPAATTAPRRPANPRYIQTYVFSGVSPKFPPLTSCCHSPSGTSTAIQRPTPILVVSSDTLCHGRVPL